MACCLMASRHYLAPYWLIISKAYCRSTDDILQEILQSSITEFSLKITYQIFQIPSGRWFKPLASSYNGCQNQNKTKLHHAHILCDSPHISIVALQSMKHLPHPKGWILSEYQLVIRKVHIKAMPKWNSVVKLCKNMFVNALSCMARGLG